MQHRRQIEIFKTYYINSPDDPSANYAYGVFLGSSNQGGKALPYLEKAAKAGYTNAYYSLGMDILDKTTLNWL